MQAHGTIFMFTYRGEEDLIPIQLDHLGKALPTFKVVLVDDEKDPIRQHLVDGLRKYNCNVTYATSSFDRQVNLNGPECIKGMLATMLEHTSEFEDDHIIVKMDPDTLLLRPEFLLGAFSAGANWYASSSVGGMYSGMMYAMKRDIMRRVYDLARIIPDFSMVKQNGDAPAMPEDISICSLATFVTGRGGHFYLDLARPDVAPNIGAFDVESHMDRDQYYTCVKAAAKALVITVGNISTTVPTPRSVRVKFALDILAELNRSDTDEVTLQEVQG